MKCVVLLSTKEVESSGFVDSGASINVVSPSLIQANSLEDQVETHDSMLALTMAKTETCHVKKRTITLSLRITGFNVYSAEFLVLPVPDERDVLLGMPWLACVNPRIDWQMGDIGPSLETLRLKLRALLRLFLYPYLCKYPDLFRHKLPAELPPEEHGEHTMDVKADHPVF
ncbi:hypothetical protein PHMEG_00013132 [Phytophthora megakarya]|uniref:Reverse transcriptase n=1 Tax=Phytophthora megakarya TaxID=4795 RepID=A0A225W7G2_9STRA|nr:hypothetical protein PHMEG_00013132 [Phytophthora megakarya]